MGDSATRTANAPDEKALEGVVLASLAMQPQPVTISRLRSSLPAPFRGKPATFTTHLGRLAESGRIWFFPSGKPNQPLVWDRSPAVFVESVVLAALNKKPLTIGEIEKKTRAKLKHLTHEDCRLVIDKLLSDRQIFRWAKKPGTKTEKLGITPPDPREYLASALKALGKAVAKVANAFSEVGISPSETYAAAIAAIQSQDWALNIRHDHKVRQDVPPPSNDEALLKQIADRMAAIDPKSRHGAPVLIGDLRPAAATLFSTASHFDTALVRLERAGRVSLLRYDPALAAQPLDPSRLVTDGHSTYSGVALR